MRRMPSVAGDGTPIAPAVRRRSRPLPRAPSPFHRRLRHKRAASIHRHPTSGERESARANRQRTRSRAGRPIPPGEHDGGRGHLADALIGPVRGMTPANGGSSREREAVWITIVDQDRGGLDRNLQAGLEGPAIAGPASRTSPSQLSDALGRQAGRPDAQGNRSARVMGEALEAGSGDRRPSRPACRFLSSPPRSWSNNRDPDRLPLSTRAGRSQGSSSDRAYQSVCEVAAAPSCSRGGIGRQLAIESACPVGSGGPRGSPLVGWR